MPAQKNDSYSDIPLDDIESVDWGTVTKPQMTAFAETMSDVNNSIDRSKRSRETLIQRVIVFCISIFFTAVFGALFGPWIALAAINATLGCAVVMIMIQRRTDSSTVQQSHEKLKEVVKDLTHSGQSVRPAA